MVTFSIPADDADVANGTPRSRASLPFAKRVYAAASPFNSSSAKRFGTPQASSTRKLLTTRDDVASNHLGRSSLASSRNIFRSTAAVDGPPASNFSPSLPNSTMKKVFAPGATPEPSRVQREFTAQASPRGMAAKASAKELFPMRIASPPPELTGEALTQRIPKEWNSKGSIYADQFLAHLCPPELDEEQRRQFFCILDLRRLKYAANEIFAKKDWKLNVINFAKEFEKSRSIILLRYGLYEFQNVKPSKDVLRRWRREHGLPEPEGEEDESTPSRPMTSKKRKAAEDDSPDASATRGKRRATDDTAETEPSVHTPTMGKNKRKASESEEQPTKMLKTTPSSAKSLFEKITNKATSEKPAGEPAAAAKPNLLASNKLGAGNNLARAVFTNLKPLPNQVQPANNTNNIFGYLSDASSAKNSGIEADAESDADSEQGAGPEAVHSNETPVAPRGAGAIASRVESTASGNDLAGATGPNVGLSSAPGTRESTPGRSLFDRVTKGSDGQPVRVEERTEAAEPQGAAETQSGPPRETTQGGLATADQTWNPLTTPIKFGPASTTTSAGSPSANAGGNAATSGLTEKAPESFATFGSVKQDQILGKESSAGVSADEASGHGGESDKENESQPSKKTAPMQAFGSSVFAAKPAAMEASRSAPSIFGAAAQSKAESVSAGAISTAGNLFGQANKPAETSRSNPAGAKSAVGFDSQADKAPATTSLIANTGSTATPAGSSVGSLFGARNTNASSSLFGAGQSTQPQQPSFGSTSSVAADSTTGKTDAPTPIFNFMPNNAGAISNVSSKSTFGVPKSPSHNVGAANQFGSPMKQDDTPPAKKSADGGKAGGESTPLFNFGNIQPAASASIFGASSAPSQSGTAAGAGQNSFGAPSSAAGSNGPGGFNFNFGGPPTTAPKGGFNNPFATAADANSAVSSGAPPSGGLFSFGASFGAGSATSSGTSTPFQFGGGSAPAPAGGSGGSLFGAKTSNTAGNAAPLFGGASAAGSTPSFNFSAGGAAPQGTGSASGSNQAVPAFNLQPPAGGSTTTGTSKSPFPHRKIAPLKRRV